MEGKAKTILWTIITIGLIGYTVFILIKGVYRTYQYNQWIGEYATDIDRLEKENERMRNLILYYQTNSFKEVEARQKLGLKAPDEKVVAMPENKDQQTQEAKPKSTDMPNYIKWWRWIFG